MLDHVVRSRRRELAALVGALILSLAVPCVEPALAQSDPRQGEPRASEPRTDDPRSTNPRWQVKVYAHTLKHQPAHEALQLIRPLLSPVGTVEEQPGGNTLVIRDRRVVIDRIKPLLERFDHPPEDLRFDIRIVRAGPKRQVISPPIATPPPVDSGLSEELVAKLRSHLRYDDYRVLAKAAMSTREGEDVTYSLGGTYSVSFRPGTLIAGPTGQRLKLEGFRILKHVENPTNKGRQLEPRELLHATLNLWIDRPFNLVLAQDPERQEALLVAISCRRESDEP